MTQMKRVMMGFIIPEKELDKVQAEIVKLIRSKKGKVGHTHISDAPPTGAGATLGSVA